MNNVGSDIDSVTRLMCGRRKIFATSVTLIAVLEMVGFMYLRGWQLQASDGQQYAENADSGLSGDR